MRWKMVGAVLVGSVVVAAACASRNGEHAREGSDGGLLDAIADALGLDRVESDVQAAEKPTIEVLKCDKSRVSGGTTLWFAQRDYPGRSKEDLARVSAIVCGAPSEYPCYQTLMALRDGGVSVQCTSTTDTVTLVVPPPL